MIRFFHETLFMWGFKVQDRRFARNPIKWADPTDSRKEVLRKKAWISESNSKNQCDWYPPRANHQLYYKKRERRISGIKSINEKIRNWSTLNHWDALLFQTDRAIFCSTNTTINIIIWGFSTDKALVLCIIPGKIQ